jgi:hypothetical protein
MKKGAGASPLFLIDPPKPDSVEVEFRPPREANLLYVGKEESKWCASTGRKQKIHAMD